MGVEDGARGRSAPARGDGPTRWLQLQDDLLRGLAHALANRVGMVAGVADLLGVSAAPAPHMIAALREEAERLEALLRLFRALPQQGGEAEPVVLAEALAVAEALVAHHPGLDGRPLRVTGPRDGVVLWAPPAAVVHALCVAVAGVVTTTPAAEVEVLAAGGTGGDGASVTVRASGGAGGVATPDDLAAIRWLMAGAPGVEVEGVAGGARLQLPA